MLARNPHFSAGIPEPPARPARSRSKSGIDDANFLLFCGGGFGAGCVAVRGGRDAEKSDSPVVPTSSIFGLPKPWQPDPQIKSLAATPAPAPDMSSAAVVGGRRSPRPPPRWRSSPAPKKKRVAKRQPRHDDGRESYAWSRNEPGPFGGGGFFGRF